MVSHYLNVGFIGGSYVCRVQYCCSFFSYFCFILFPNHIKKNVLTRSKFNRRTCCSDYTRKAIVVLVCSCCFVFFRTTQITKFGLRLLTGTRFFNGYDRRVNAQMTAGFSVAAYRFGHTLIQEWFRRFNQRSFQHREKSEFRPIPVLDFENPQYLYETCQGGVDAILRGLIKDPAGKADG